MAKRFTDTNKYKKPFIRSLPGAYKILWDFLYHDCDHAGIWTVDFETAQIYVGKDMPISRERALELFNQEEKRVVEIDRGKKWFLPGFIDFQYGQLSEKNRAHQSVILLLKKVGVLNADLTIQKENKPLTSPLQGAMDMDKDKDMDKEKEIEEGVGGETIDQRLDAALVDLYLEPLAMKAPTLYPGVDFNLEVARFRQKVTGSPRVYAEHDTGGLRLALEHQLRNARPSLPNGKAKPDIKKFLADA